LKATPLVLAFALLAPAGVAGQTTGPITIAQLQYGGGGDWYANPTGVKNLLREIRKRTGLSVSDQAASTKITDPALWNYPFLYMTGHGNVRFTDEEVTILRRYLESGGFLHADDNYGMDESFRREIRKIFPEATLTELPPSHPIYRSFYQFPNGLPKIHKHDGKPPQGFGIFHRGRLVVYYTYETDLGNGWEDQNLYDDSPALREKAFQMGVNVFVFALSQVTT
jgi:hypothetical protein